MKMAFKEEITDFFNNPDPRVAGWPLMQNPLKTVMLVAVYLVFIKILCPAWMKNRKPYDLRFLMIIYNFFQVALSAWVFINLGRLGWFTKYSWSCEPIDFSYNADAIGIAEVCWVCFIGKFLELADTVFFVLRKKDTQITFLHVFHHASVPLTTWIGVKYAAGGYNTIFPLLNSFVHIWMYLYYGFAAMGPSAQKYLWWKKYLVKLEMLQFIIVLIFMSQLYLVPICKVSRVLILINLFQGAICFVMFLNFYTTSYKKGSASKKKCVEGTSRNVNFVREKLN